MFHTFRYGCGSHVWYLFNGFLFHAANFRNLVCWRLYGRFAWLCSSEKNIVQYFPPRFRYQILHGLLMYVCMDLVSMSVPFWNPSGTRKFHTGKVAKSIWHIAKWGRTTKGAPPCVKINVFYEQITLRTTKNKLEWKKHLRIVATYTRW